MTRETFVYIGTYTHPIQFGNGSILEGKGEGIYVYRLNQSLGALEFISKTTDIKNPSFLALDSERSHLYAVNELKTFEGNPTGTVSAFSINSKTKTLEFLNKKQTQGMDPCHLTLDKTGRYILVANYTSGSLCVLPIRTDGSLGEATNFIQHHGSSIDPKRQKGPHAHSITLDKNNRYAFVPDLGIDKIMIYTFDSNYGTLELNDEPWIQVKSGSGPRHFTFHPNGEYAYLINELNSTLVVFEYDQIHGKLEEVQTVPTIPLHFYGTNNCADVQVSPLGTFLYGSNRGHDSIIIYHIDQLTGNLTYVDHESTQGRTPRNFTIDPTGKFLLVANQDTDTIIIFRIAEESGKLTFTGYVTKVPTPVCIKTVFHEDS